MVSISITHWAKRYALLAALLLPILANAPGAPVYADAGGTTCSPTTASNPADVACITGQNGVLYTAASGVWADNNLNIAWDSTNPYRFILDGMWVYTSPNYYTWVETNNLYGTCYANNGGQVINVCPRGTDPTHPHAYRSWADASSPTVQYNHWIEWWSVNDSYQHTFQISRETGNICLWDIYIDDIKQGTSYLQSCPGGYSYGYEVDTGLEHTCLCGYAWNFLEGLYSDNYYSNTVSNEQLQTWHGGAWQNWEYQYSWNGNEPCGGSYTTNCYNGTNDGYADIWRTNRLWDRGT